MASRGDGLEAGTTMVAVLSGRNALYFDQADDGSFKVRFFGQEKLAYDSGAGLYVLTDSSGDQIKFYDFESGVSPRKRGQFKSYTTAQGTTTVAAYSGGKISTLTRSVSGVSGSDVFTYTYISGGDNDGLVQKIQLTVNGAAVRTVVYGYYGDTQAGTLESATIYDGDATTADKLITGDIYIYNGPTGSGPGISLLSSAYEGASYFQLSGYYGGDTGDDLDSDIEDDGAPPVGDMASYILAGSTLTQQGLGATQDLDSSEAGTGNRLDAQGTYSITDWQLNPLIAKGINDWVYSYTLVHPDGSYEAILANFAGEVLVDSFTALKAGTSITAYQYDDDGRMVLKAMPSAVSGFDDSKQNPLGGSDDALNVSGTISEGGLNASKGLIYLYTYGTSDSGTGPTSAGDMKGYLKEIDIAHGTGGAKIKQESRDYFKDVFGDITIAPLADDTVYGTDTGGDARKTSFTYIFNSSPQKISATVTPPDVSDKAGAGSGAATYAYDAEGNINQITDGNGNIVQFTYDPATGALTKQIVDPNGLRIETDYTDLDGLGRAKTITEKGGASGLADRVTTVNYNDPDHTVTTTAPTGIQTIIRTDYTNDYVETLTKGLDSDGHPTVTVGLARMYFDLGGRAIETDGYYNLSGLSYSNNPHLGSVWVVNRTAASGNYYASFYHYDLGGNRDVVLNGNGTITQTAFDGYGRAVAVKVGIDAGYTPLSIAASTMPDGSKLALVESYQYNNASADGGDGTLARVTLHPTGTVDAASDRTTSYYYDWRDRLVGTIDGRLITYDTLDNLGEVTEEQQYDGIGRGGGPWISALGMSSGVPVAPASGRLRAQTISLHDDQGRIWKAQTYNVDQGSGSTSAGYLYTQFYYDGDGNVIAVYNPGGLVDKYVYDVAGRRTGTYVTDGAGGMTAAAAASVDNDHVLTESLVSYDNFSDITLQTTYARASWVSSTTVGALSLANAKLDKTANYFDAAGHLTDTVDFGNSLAILALYATTPPTTADPAAVNGSDQYLWTHYTYDAAGNVATVKDPRGLISSKQYDALGRVTKEDDGFGHGEIDDRISQYEYTATNQLRLVTTEQASSDYARFVPQSTTYTYGAQIAVVNGQLIASDDLAIQITYADSSHESYLFNTLGEKGSETERNGIKHVYTYDYAGRLSGDLATNFPSAVDNTVQALSYAYDVLGKMIMATSEGPVDGGWGVINQVQREFNGLGQLLSEAQSHSGAVGSRPPTVAYDYDQSGNFSRLEFITDPQGHFVDYNYGSGIDDNISRVTSIEQNEITLENYTYQGLDTMVGESIPLPDGYLMTHAIQLDKFGRVLDDKWTQNRPTGGPVDQQHVEYGYDADGNVLYAQDDVNNALSELYHLNGVVENAAYTDLNMVQNFSIGILNGAKDSITAPSYSVSYKADSQGSFRTITVNGTLTDSMSYGAAGDLIAGGTSDSGGDTTSISAFGAFVNVQYDAWGRLVDAKSENGETKNAYDALGRQITRTQTRSFSPEGSADTQSVRDQQDFYYDESGKVLDVRDSSGEVLEYVYSPRGQMVLRDYTPGHQSTPTQRLYAITSPDGSIAAVTDTHGRVLERYIYDPTGNIQVLTAAGAAEPPVPSYRNIPSPRIYVGEMAVGPVRSMVNGTPISSGGSQVGWDIFWHGLEYDGITGLYLQGGSAFSPRAGRGLQPIVPAALSYSWTDTQLNRSWGDTFIQSIVNPESFGIGGTYQPSPAEEWTANGFVFAGILLTGGAGAYSSTIAAGAEAGTDAAVAAALGNAGQFVGSTIAGAVIGGAITGSYSARHGGGFWEGAGLGFNMGVITGGMLVPLGALGIRSAAGAIGRLPNIVGLEWAVGAEVDGNYVLGMNYFLRPMRPAAIQEAVDDGILSEVTARQAGLVAPPDHHIFPQEYGDWFAARGVNVDQYTITLDQATHEALHYGGGPGLGGGWWNDTLMTRLSQQELLLGRMLTPDEIQAEGLLMLQRSGLGDLPIHPWNSTK